MQQSSDGTKIRTIIKTLMKNKGLRYRDAADILEVSIPTVKRILNSDEISLNRLIKICQWLDVSIYELIEMAQDDKLLAHNFTEAQENYLAGNLRSLLVFRCFVRGLTAEEAAAQRNLTEVEMHKIIREMEELKLVERNKNRVKLKVEWPFQWSKGGPLEKSYKDKIAKYIVERACEIAATDPQKPFVMRPFELAMQEDNMNKFIERFSELFSEYRAVARMDMLLHHPNELLDASGIFAVGDFCVWDGLLGEEGSHQNSYQ